MAQITDSIPGTSSYIDVCSNPFYRCAQCGVYVAWNTAHVCIRTNSTVGAFCQCPRCGDWGWAGLHTCPPASPLACNHCRCIDVPPSGERTKLHRRCCKCHDVMIAD